MADVQVLYDEEVAAITANSTTWVDLAIIPAASFTANARYLIIASEAAELTGSATNETRVRIVHGTTPTVFDDASLAWEGNATQEHEVSYLIDYTQPATTELVKIQISTSATNTVTNKLSQIIAINLDDLGASFFMMDEELVDYTITATPTAQAITASFTPNGTDRWLYIGHMIWSPVTITDEIGFEVYDSVAGVLNSMQQEGEDATNDFLGANLYWVGVPTNAARTVAVRPFNEGGSNIALQTRVIAINLAGFAQSASTFDATEIDPATSPTYTTAATISITPDATGNFVYICGSVQDVNETTTDWGCRVQVNPDGSGLIDDPDFVDTTPQIDQWDPLDEIPVTVFKLRQLNAGGSRTINWDWKQVAGTTGRIEDHFAVVFSVAKPSVAAPPIGSIMISQP